MSFNPDLNKYAQEVKSSRPQIYFNNAPVSCVSFQKHLGVYLKEKLNFSYHIKEKTSKAMKGIGVMLGVIKGKGNMLA